MAAEQRELLVLLERTRFEIKALCVAATYTVQARK
jgi:hypothetical protein